MFKIFKNTAVSVLLAAIMLTGCSTSVKDSVENVAAENNWFYRISDTPMVYDKDTHVMYYLFSKYFGNQGYGSICLLIIMSTVRCAITLMVRLFLSRRC